MLKKLIKKLRKSDKGFTLIEMIVVIAIIGVLVAIAIPSVGGIINSAKQATAQANARTAYMAAQMYVTQQTAAGASAPATMSQGNISSLLGGTYKGTVSITMNGNNVGTVTYTDGTISATYPQ